MNRYRHSFPQLSVALALLVFATPASADITSGLVGWWKLDEGSGATAPDSSGNGNHGAITGATQGSRQGRGCLIFDGNDSVIVPNSPVLTPTAMTLAIWAHIDEDAGPIGLMDKFDNEGGNRGYALAGTTGDFPAVTNSSYRIPSIAPAMKVSSDGANMNDSGGSRALKSRWQHIVLTYTSGSGKTYVNGELVTSTNVGVPLPSSSSWPLRIGHSPEAFGYYMKGGLRDARIYNRVLTAADVQELYESDALPGPRSHYDLESDVQDGSGNSHHGSVAGAPTYVRGVIGRGLKLQGTSDEVNIGPDQRLEVATVAAFVRLDEVGDGPATQNIVTSWESEQNFVLGIERDAQGQSRVTAKFRKRQDSSHAWPEQSATGTTVLTPGVFHHAALSYDGSTLRLFVDGREEASSVLSGTPDPTSPDSPPEVRIGHITTGTSALNGTVDEVFVYDRALSAYEIRMLASGSKGQVVYEQDFDTPGGTGGIFTDSNDFTNATAPGTAQRATTSYLRSSTAASSPTFRVLLPEVPTHTQVTVAFDLYVAGAWTGSTTNHRLIFGSGTNPNYVPIMGEPGGVISFDATFANALNGRQQFPSLSNSGLNPSKRGAYETNTLGYGQDAVYRVVKTIPHDRASLFFDIHRPGQAAAGQDWGIDNLVVSVGDEAPLEEAFSLAGTVGGSGLPAGALRAQAVVAVPNGAVDDVAVSGGTFHFPTLAAPEHYYIRGYVDSNGNGLRDPSEWVGTANGGSPVYLNANLSGIHVTPAPPVDSDSDGMSDEWELENGLLVGTNDSLSDKDNDGLSNIQEYGLGTSVKEADTDGDTIDDGEEYLAGMNPTRTDSDGDVMTDAYERANGLDSSRNDTGEDSDFDFVTNLEEFTNGTKANNAFSGTDGISDYRRLNGKGMWKAVYDRNNRFLGQLFDNGMSLIQGYDANSNPTRQILREGADHDRDGLQDLWEVANGLDPNSADGADGAGDADNDGVTNLQEAVSGTDPRSAAARTTNDGSMVATSSAFPWAPDRYVMACGQLDGAGIEEMVVSGDGDPGTAINVLKIFTPDGTGTTWTEETVEVGGVGVTSICIGHINAPNTIFIGTRAVAPGLGQIIKLVKTAGVWTPTVMITSTDQVAFVAGYSDYNSGKLLAQFSSSGLVQRLHHWDVATGTGNNFSDSQDSLLRGPRFARDGASGIQTMRQIYHSANNYRLETRTTSSSRNNVDQSDVFSSNTALVEGPHFAVGVVGGSRHNYLADFVQYRFRDVNTSGSADPDDDCFLAEELVSGATRTQAASRLFQPASMMIATGTVFPNGQAGSSVMVTGDADGVVSTWSVPSSANQPLTRRLLTGAWRGKVWHDFRSLRGFGTGDSAAGLAIDPENPTSPQIVVWPADALRNNTSAPVQQTAPLARIAPSPSLGGRTSPVDVDVWDAEGNTVSVMLQFREHAWSPWATATLLSLDGGDPSAFVSAAPSGARHRLLWNAAADLGANFAGNVLLRTRATDAGDAGAWSEQMIYAVGLSSQTITFAPIDDQLANATVNLSATGGDSGNAVTFAVTDGPATITGGNQLSFTGAGAVTVTAYQAGSPTYEAADPVARTFNVSKANASVTLDHLSQSYDGTPKAATAITDPVGKSVTFTYDGAGSAPTNTGSYTVVGTIDDPIYQGSSTGTLVITKASQTIMFAPIPNQMTTAMVNLSATGGGSGNAVIFSVSGPGQINGDVLSFTGPGSVTVRANQAGNANYEAAPEVAHTFTVMAVGATVTLSDLAQTYDGTQKSASVTTNPDGIPVSLVHAPASPVNAGSYSVSAMITDPRFTGSANGILVIAKAAQTITLAPIEDQIASATLILSATGGGSGNAVTFVVTDGPATFTGGNQLSFTGAGSVTITAFQSGNANYEAASPVARTFNVTKADATVTLDSLAHTFDGTPKAATATTDPSGKSVNFTYDGGSTVPTNAGSYVVVGTISDPVFRGSASGILVIAKAAQFIAFANPGTQLSNATVNLSATGGGSNNPVTFAVTSGPGSISEGNVLTFTGTGSVTITASQVGNANYEDATAVARTFDVIAAPEITLSGNGQTIADGDPTPSPDDHTDFGSVALTGDTLVRTFTVTNNGTTALHLSGSPKVEIGGPHAADFTVTTDPVSPVDPDGGTTTFTITFDPSVAGVRSAIVSLATNDPDENPATFAIQGNGQPSGNADLETLTLSEGNLAPVFDAATTSYTASVANTTSSIRVTPTVAGANARIEARVNEGIFNPVTSGSPSGVLALNVGSNSVEVRVTAEDTTTTKTYAVTVTRDKAAQAITGFSNPGPKVADTTVDLSATGGGSNNPVTFTAEGPASIDGSNVLSFTGTGSVTIRANQAGDANYHPAPEVAHTFTVTAAMATVTLHDLAQTYDGTPKSATATTNPPGLAFSLVHDPASPVNAGSYGVTATVTDPRYLGSAADTLVIAKATQTLTGFVNPGNQSATASLNLSATGGASGNGVVFSVNTPGQITGNTLTFTGPGSVTVRANQAGNGNYHAAPEVAHSFEVTAEAATLTLSRLHQVADGSAREVLVTTDPEDLEIEVTYDGETDAPTAPGSYAVVAASADARYEGSGGGTLIVDDPARSVVVPGGGLPALSALGELLVPTFRIGAYEVTGSQWATVVAWAEANAGYAFDGAGSAASGDRPVTGVSWFDAAKWCNARTEWENALFGRSLAPAYRVGGAVYKTGTPASAAELTCDFGAGGHRLPTAAEWEYAARGGASGTPSTYPGGNALEGLAWYVGNSSGAVQPAGGKAANGLDLYDLAGNVAEWSWDGPSGTPDQRLLRGGAWSSSASACELGALSGESAALRLDRSGFRIASSVSLALAAALDNETLAWNSGGDAPWFAQTGTTHDTIDAAESGPLSQGQTSWVETTVTGPGNLRIRGKTAGSDGYDVLTFALDSVPAHSRSGTGDWEERLVEIGGGTHTVRWTYTRGSAGGEARAWLDTVSYETASPPSVTTTPPGDLTTTGATLGGEVTDDGGRSVTVRGVVYGTAPDPTLENGTDLPAATGGVGAFTLPASGLVEGTTYFARAYATNNLGTSYGGQVVFTTDTTVTFPGGIGTVTDRPILAGDRQVFRFTLAGARMVNFTGTGGAGFGWELRNAANAVVASGNGDVALARLLLGGNYSLVLTNATATDATVSLNLDASVVAVSRPDVQVGPTAAATVGGNQYTPIVQTTLLTSRTALPVTGFASVGNDSTLPTVLRVFGTRGTTFFRATYFGRLGTNPNANLTAQMNAGTYATASLENTSAPVTIRAAIVPNRSLLVSSRRVGTRVVTTTRRKTFNAVIRATTGSGPVRTDTATIRVNTR